MKKIFKLFIVLFLLITPNVCQAETARLNNGLFQADYSITVNENMEGSGFVAGNVVSINNEVDGILFTAGNVVNVNSKSDYIFAAGSSVTLGGSKFKDGFFAGTYIELNDVSSDRDIYAAGQKITLTGSVGRNLFVAGETVIVDGEINGDLYVDATELIINSNTKINGKLKYNEDSKLAISKDAIIVSKTTYKNNSASTNLDSKSLTKATIVSKLIDTLVAFLNMLIVGLLMVLLIPSIFNKLREIEPKRLLPSFAWGLLILLSLPVVALIIMFTYIGFSAGTIALVLYGVLVYVSTIICTYVITSLILKDKVKNPYLVLLIGLPCIYIIKLIPFLGGLVSFASICLGLGLLTNIIKRK